MGIVTICDVTLWRPVLAGLCSWSDIKAMTIDEFFDCLEVLEVKNYLEKLARKQQPQ